MLPRNGLDVLGVIKLCEIKAALNRKTSDGSPDEAIALALDLFDSRPVIRWWNSSAASPKAFALWSQDESLFMCNGTENYLQTTLQVSAFLDIAQSLPQTSNNGWISPWVRNASQFYYDNLKLTPFFDSPKVMTFGHSAGHGIAADLLNLRLTERPGYGQSQYHNISIGGNGFCRDSGLRSSARYNSIRYMNDDDPVPTAPWCFGVFNDIIWQYTAGNLELMSGLRHVGRGIQLDVDGNAKEITQPERALIQGTIDMAHWFASFIADTRSPHQTSEYIRRFRLNIGTPVVVQAPVNPPRPFPPGFPSRGDPITTVQQRNDYLARNAERIVVASTEVQQARGVVVPHDIYRARKIHGQWVVVKGGAVAVVSNGKKSAKSQARNLNRLANSSARLGITIADQMP